MLEASTHRGLPCCCKLPEASLAEKLAVSGSFNSCFCQVPIKYSVPNAIDPTLPPSRSPMAKLTGNTNYKLSEVCRLLALVEKYLPLGMDEWERLANDYNSNRGRGIVERDYESLRRKFKMLYGTRKPTGVAEMPPHVKKAKQLKQAVDEMASVVEMDDGPDEDGQDEDDEQPDLCFDFEGDDAFGQDPPVEGGACTGGTTTEYRSGSTTSSDSLQHDEPKGLLGGDINACSPTALAAESSDFSDLLESAAVHEGLEAFASTPRPPPAAGRPVQRKLRSSGSKKPYKVPIMVNTAITAASVTSEATTEARGSDKNSVGRTRDPKEAKRYLLASNRLGVSNLAEFRDTIGHKRAYEEDDKLLEASYAKIRRVKAARAASELKKQLGDLESTSNTMGDNMFEMMLMMRQENERRLEARRSDEEQRRRDEMAAREARYIAEKAEAEERRRQEKMEMEERARRDKEEARARTQELMLFIGALTNKR